mgnify:CR=1 FL=1
MKDDKLYNRRLFFKKAAKSILPIIAFPVVGMTFISCDRDEPDSPNDSSSCSGSCKEKVRKG